MKGLWKQLLIDGADEEFVYSMKKEYKRCIRVSRQRRWSASNNASIDASIDASISPPPCPPNGKEGSEEKVNPPISPQDSLSRACEGKPTLEEVAELIKANKYTFDAEAFWNYYESRGWMIGQNPIVSWHALCALWQRREDRHIDKTSSGRRASNWVGATDKQIKEFCDGLEG